MMNDLVLFVETRRRILWWSTAVTTCTCNLVDDVGIVQGFPGGDGSVLGSWRQFRQPTRRSLILISFILACVISLME